MKNTFVKALALALALVTVVCLLASCGKTISGTYAADVGSTSIIGGSATYKFSGSKVTISVTAGIAGFEKTTAFEGKYEINEDQITFTFEDSDAGKYNGTQSFEKGDDYIKIGGVTYTKVK